MSDVREFTCPSCGAVLSFAAGTEEVSCEYCHTKIPVVVLNTINESPDGRAEFDWGDYKRELSGEHLQNTRVYECRSCGAELETDATTASTTCPYCNSNVVLTDRVGGSLRPNAIIPFKITSKELPETVNRFYKDKKLLPKGFFNESRLRDIQGIYVPFWLYSCHLAGKVNLNAVTVSHYSDSRYNYTKTSRYLLAREGEMSFDDLPVDASVKMRDDLMDSVEPFDYGQMVDFNEAYLAGYVSDRFDSDPDNELERAANRMMTSAGEAFAAQERRYSRVSIANNAMKIDQTSVRYALMPIYLLNCEYKGKKYQYAVNGQTGKVVGELPICRKKAAMFFFRAFGIAAAIAFAALVLLQLL